MRLLVLFIFFFLSSNLIAQDVVTVKRWTLKGKLVEYKDGKAVFVTDEGLTMTLDEGYKLKVDKMDAADTTLPPDLSRKYPGFQAQFQFGVTVPKENPDIGISYYGGIDYSLRHFIALGISAGYEGFTDMRLIPVVGRLSGTIVDQKVAPYYDLSIGFSYGKSLEEARWEGELDPVLDGGFRFAPALGFKIQDRLATTFTMGLISQKTSKTTGYIDWQGNPVTTRQDRTTNMVTFRIGFIF